MNYEQRSAKIQEVWNPRYDFFGADDPSAQKREQECQGTLLMLEAIYNHDSEYITHSDLAELYGDDARAYVIANQYVVYFCGAVQKLLKSQFYIVTDTGQELILNNRMVLDMIEDEKYHYQGKEILFRYKITKEDDTK